jgi:signal transduction histidine kinase
MIRRISTKLLLAVLAAVVLPFLGLAVFVDYQMGGRLSRDVVLSSLKGLAADLAGRVDRVVGQYRGDVRFLAASTLNDWAIRERFEAETERLGQDGNGELKEEFVFRDLLAEQFDAAVLEKGGFDALFLIDYEGRLVATNRIDHSRNELAPELLADLAARDFSREPWFEAGMLGQPTSVDQHRSTLLPQPDPDAPQRPEDFHIGFTEPVYSQAEPEREIGVLYVLINWSPIQKEVNAPVLKSYFQGLVGPEEFPSAYAWIWGADADTILAHDDPSLYGESISSSARVGLPALTQAALAADWELYPPYEFRGKQKSAAFKHTASPEQGGFGWVVGVGIDDDDIFQAVRELRALLFKATLGVLLVAVLLTMVIARRTTGPILALREHTQRVAAGDLEAQIEVGGHDELRELAGAFNAMTRDLKASREQLVRAEKDAAWREMARQIAHDIKNPLTPIQLSVDLLKRARDDASPQFDAIFERTVETVRRQVAHLRDIAGDFHALTGVGRARAERVDLAALCGEVLDLHAAWAEERGVRTRRTGGGGLVRADPTLLRRVLQNLVSNAVEAMPEGGELCVDVERAGGRVRLEVRDTGVGVPDEVRPRLFEPYFTTRSSGTGLGLAIARRVIEEAGGTIELVPAEPGPGTVARVDLPAFEAGSA